MTLRTRYTFVCLVCLLVSSVAVSMARAQESRGVPTLPDRQPSSTPPPEIVAAEELIYLAYPDLRGRDLSMSFRITGPQVAVGVVEAGAAKAATDDARLPTPLALVLVEFTENRELKLFYADGQVTDRNRNLALQDVVFRNPGLGDAAVEAWLGEAGGTATVNRSIDPLSKFDSAGWAKFLGSNPRAGSASFQLRDPGSGRLSSKPRWRALVETGSPGTAGATYQFEFEPFSGRLVRIVRQ